MLGLLSLARREDLVISSAVENACTTGDGGQNRQSDRGAKKSLHDPKLVPDEADPSKTKVVAAFAAKARVTVWSADGSRSIVREGCGAARGFARTAGEAMENALKSAATDALKRALVTFGNALGLALYDKALGRRYWGANPHL